MTALVWRHLRERPGRMLAMLALALLLAGFAVLPPVLVARAVDGAISGGLDMHAALIVAAGIAGLALADGGLTLLRRRLAVANEIAVRSAAAHAHFRTSTRLDLPAYAAGNSTALIRSFDDLDSVVEFAAARAVDLFAEATIIASYAVLMLVVEQHLALVFLGMAALGLGCSIMLGGAARRACDAWLPVRDQRFGFIVECLTAMLTIKSLSAHADIMQPFGVAQGREEALLRRYRERLALADAVARFWSIATPGVGAACGAILLIDGRLTAGALLLFLSVSAGLGGALAALHGHLQELNQARASLARMAALHRHPPELLEDGAAPAGAAAPPPALRATGLRYRHAGATRDTLAALDLAIAPGEHVAVIGRSGAGKTTLAQLLARLLGADAGMVTLGDGAHTLDRHRRRVILVPHATSVFGASLRDNIRLWNAAVGDAAIAVALARAGLHDTVAAWRDGLDTLLGPLGNPLSAGQQQRLGLARMFLHRPDVLILDEATSAMDAPTEQAVLDEIRAFMAGRTLLVITHRDHIAAQFDRTLRIEGGQVACASA